MFTLRLIQVPAVTLFRCLASMSPKGSTRAWILPGCPILYSRSREADFGFEPRTFHSLSMYKLLSMRTAVFGTPLISYMAWRLNVPYQAASCFSCYDFRDIAIRFMGHLRLSFEKQCAMASATRTSTSRSQATARQNYGIVCSAHSINQLVIGCLNGSEMAQWLEREITDGKVRDSNPTAASRPPLSRFRQTGSIPAPVLPSDSIAAGNRTSVTVERFIFRWLRADGKAKAFST
ncbi:hypothetical protein CSKR_104745 [Clonorchis sinensis]|uniref:Uncharacterized protein n=1 Tax=Clonorchis sinensis TaxID=79923 RepID=A0A3R7JRC2_CLOSI|nr:hypothetical protein CSKR_104745 [Clonorchis sinensis]